MESLKLPCTRIIVSPKPPVSPLGDRNAGDWATRFLQEVRAILSLSGSEAIERGALMKKLLLLCLPLTAVAGLQAWSQALAAEPAPVQAPGIVVPYVAGDHGGPDGR
jgi:hypothetical protein